MKALLVLSLLLISATAFSDFHLSYISKFQSISEDSVSQSFCETYGCSPSALPSNQCVHNQQGKNYLQVCPSGSFCPWALSSHFNTTCVEGSDVISYGGVPGDVCSSNSDCQGLSFCNMTRGVCQGYTTGHSCNDQPDCDVGYACHNVEMAATCQPMKTLGGTCGNYLSMVLCQNTLACNYGQCVNLFSKKNGQFVDQDVGALVCESGFFDYAKGRHGQAACAAAPQSPRANLPISCNAGSFCRSRDGKYQTPCQCGYNSNGQGYCPLFPGDDIYQQYLASLKSYMTDPGLNQCHYLDIGMPSCQGVSQTKYETVVSLHNQVLFFVAKMGNDKCVKNIITPAYWFN